MARLVAPRGRTMRCILAVIFVASVFVAGFVLAERSLFGDEVEVVGPAPIRIRPIFRPGSTNPTVVGPANLETDTAHQEQLARADRYAKNGRYDLAVLVWQKILDDAGDVLTTLPEWHAATIGDADYRWFRPLREQIEATIAGLPAAGIQAYRDHVDVQAKQLIKEATGDDRERMLATIVRRFFLSSVGDAAAMELASRALDRHDFSHAWKLLTKLGMYPDSEIPQHAVAVRLAVANAQLGDHEASRAAIESAAQAIRDGIPQRTVVLLREELTRLAEDAAATQQPTARRYPMLLATAERRGVMPAIPSDATHVPFRELWYDEFYEGSAETPPQATKPLNRRAPIRRPRGGYPNPVKPTVQQLVGKWKNSAWRPAAQLLVHDGKVFFKSQDRVMCRDIVTGKLEWLSPPFHYQPVRPAANQQVRLIAPAPQHPVEQQFFADRVHHSMTIVGDNLLTLEPVSITGTHKVFEQRGREQIVNAALPRSNRIIAYDTRTGKRLWARDAVDDPAAQPEYFLAAPVAASNGLVVPLWRDHAFWLISLDAKTGEIGWSTRLCGEPTGGRSVWSPIGVGVEGSTAYVATGAGVVVAVDVRVGSVQWASVYSRGATQNGQAVLDGCDEDVVIPYGPLVIVLATDSRHIFALERGNGKFVWHTPRRLTDASLPVRYCLGVRGDCLYLASSRVVRCYNAAGGRALWEHGIDESFGRAAITDDTIYLPTQSEILCLDPTAEYLTDAERLQGTIHVERASDEPLGNLVADGGHLLMMGMARVAKLGPQALVEDEEEDEL